MNYQINPCNACKSKYPIKDLNNINECCFNIVSRYYGNNNILDIQNTPEYKNCVNCTNQSVHALGKKPIDLRNRPAFPNERNQTTFSYYMRNGMNTQDSLNNCINNCRNTPFPNQCIENCNLDASAVIESYSSPPVNSWKVGIF
jgi:hypothetical protein